MPDPIKIGASGAILNFDNTGGGINFEEGTLLNNMTSSVDIEEFGERGDIVLGRYGIEPLQSNLYNNQSIGEYILKGIGNAAITAIGEVIKGIGYAGGGVIDVLEGLSGRGWNVDTMLNNQFNNGIQAGQDIAKDWIAVHKPEDFNDKSLGQQLIDPSFWATEGADGVGFLVSFLAPGQLLKMANVGGKTSSALGKTLMKGYGKSGTAFDADRVANNINSSLAIGVNTWMEAAAEGTHAFDSIYAKAIQDGNTDEEARQIAAKGARDIFVGNIPILLISNTILEGFIMSGFNRFKGGSAVNRITNDVISGAASLTPASFKRSAGIIGGRAVIGVGQEGFVEEGLQTSLEQSVTEGHGILGAFSQYYDNLTSILQGMSEQNTEAKDFGRSVVLGGLLGGGMGAVSGKKEVNDENRLLFGSEERSIPKNAYGTFQRFLGMQDRKASKGLVAQLQNAYADTLKSRKDFMNTDEEGNYTGIRPEIIDDISEGIGKEMLITYYNDLLLRAGGNVKVAKSLVEEALNQHGDGKLGMEALSQYIYDMKEAFTNEEALAQSQANMDMKYFFPFFQQEGGKQLLDEHISTMVEANAQRYLDNTGVEMTNEMKSSLENDLKTKSNKYYKIYSEVNKNHNPLVLTFNPYNDTNLTEEQINKRKLNARRFWEGAYGAKMQAAVHSQHADERISLLLTERNSLISIDLDGNDNTSKVNKKKVEEIDNQIKLHRQNKEQAESTLEKLSTSDNLQSEWDKWINKTEEIEKESQEEIKAEEAENKSLKNEFVDELKEAGYNVDIDENNAIKISDDEAIILEAGSNGKRIVIRRDNSGKWIIMDDGKSKPFTKISDIYKAYKGKVRIISKDQLKNERANRRIQLARQKEQERRNAQIKALEELLDRRNSQRKEIETRLNNIYQEQRVLKQEIEDMKEDLKSAPNKRIIYTIHGNKIRSLIKSHERLIDNLEQEYQRLADDRQALSEHIEHINQWIELASETKFSLQEEAKTLNEEVNHLFDLLDNPILPEESIQAINEQMSEISQTMEKVRQQIDLLKVHKEDLEKFLAEHESMKLWMLFATESRELQDKYRYYDEDSGQMKKLPVTKEFLKNLKRRRSARKQFFVHMTEFGLHEDKTNTEILNELESDIKELDKKQLLLKSSIQEKADVADHLLSTVIKIKNLEKLLDSMKSQYEFLDLAKSLQIVDKNLNKYVERATNHQTKIPVSETTLEDVSIQIDNPNVTDESISGKLPVDLLHTSGLNIMYNAKGDVTVIDTDSDGNLITIPKVNPNKYQQNWFNFTDQLSDTSNYKIYLVKADYNIKDDLHQTFALANPNNRSESDIWSVIVDSNTLKPIKVNNEYVFTSIMKTETMFPENKKPRISEFHLLDRLLKKVNKNNFDRDSFEKNKTLNQSGISPSLIKKLSQLTGLELDNNTKIKELLPYAISDARIEYNDFRNKVIESPKYADITSVSNGHAIKVTDKDNNRITSNPMKSLKNRLDKGYKVDIANQRGKVNLDINQRSGFIPGTPIMHIKSTNQIIPLHSGKLNENTINVILKAFDTINTVGIDATLGDMDNNLGDNYYIINKKKYGQNLKILPNVKDQFSLLTLLLNFGLPRDKKKSKFSLFLDRKRGIIHYGLTGKISLQEVMDNSKNQDFKDFLRTKKLDINAQLVSQANYSKNNKKIPFFFPTFQDGKIVFERHNSYLDFMFNTGGLYSNVPNKIKGLPQFAQRNISFSNPTNLIVKKKEVNKKEIKQDANSSKKTKPIDIYRRILNNPETAESKLGSILAVWNNLLADEYKVNSKGEIPEIYLEHDPSGSIQSALNNNLNLADFRQLASYAGTYVRDLFQGKINKDGSLKNKSVNNPSNTTGGIKVENSFEVESKQKESNEELSDAEKIAKIKENRKKKRRNQNRGRGIDSVDRVANPNKTLREMVKAGIIKKECK